ncbi:ZPR1 zinc finger domain-containing protein [Methanobrevibacter olleyae]|uniref:ZPR1 zinc-finger domain-containing protein n=1 Tax=Methanobrevibacter olleyae TaxID=294671 RepID=A0A126QYC9_METOL|nr:ZPR1 zinc finger domain-containing protein [Methanobrevibacter olleyae]AMK14838.1 ZPR1 zinc-finger domain-containing protein [Methanobrevibacter olleyae]SFL35087.1 zinc finger protein [Methanobrevibacter olleyae]
MNLDDVSSGKGAEMKIDCPVCGGKNTATYTTQTHEIAYFGEIVESTIQCEKCGFRHNDILATEQKDPAKHSLTITEKSLDSRIVRSQSATVSLPEIGIKVEPGPKSEGYISNVEGVLLRFIATTERAMNIFQDDLSQENGKKVLNDLNKVLNGELETLLLIEDPFGQSKIMDIHAKTEPLTDEELKHLKTGFTVIDEN